MIAIFLLYGCSNDEKKDNPILEKPYIGIAWSPTFSQETIAYWTEAVKELGGEPVYLGQVKSDDDWYLSDGSMDQKCFDKNGMLALEYGQKIKKKGFACSNAAEVLKGVDAVLFPGGEDISTSLFAQPVEPTIIEGYCPSRDVSDYLLMDYCLSKKVPVLGICRGSQILAIVSGASLIQDLPLYCDEIGVTNKYVHRLSGDDTEKPLARHNIEITDPNSIMASIVQANTLDGVPSWHHQAICKTEGTPLKITAHNVTDGLDVIEAIERTDQLYCLGVQFHPEYICAMKLVYDVEDEQCDYRVCFRFFTDFVEKAQIIKAQKAE